MHRSRTALFAAILALGLLFALPGIASPPNGHPQGKHGADTVTVQYCSGTDQDEDEDRDRVIYDGPEWMWPPNHKYRDLTVTAVAAEDEDEVALATQGTHDEYIDGDPENEMNGAGNTADDVDGPTDMDTTVGDSDRSGEAQTAHSVRAERSGRGDGRTYTITYQAWFGDADPDPDDPTCTGEFEIEVPHSMGRSADNKKVHEPGDPDDD